MTLKNQAINLFKRYINEPIKSIKQIHNGFTNTSFKINNYQVRLGGTNKQVNRLNENKIINTILKDDFVYYDKSNGNAIKNWIIGKNPNQSIIKTCDFINKFIHVVNKLHNSKLKLIKHNHLDCLKKSKLQDSIKKFYIRLINEIKDDKIVPCHNDLSIENMLIDKNNNVILIDYEWARMNSIYWECANFIRNTNYNLKQINLFCKLAKLNYEHMKKYLFICSCYAYQWTFNMPQTNKVLSYRKITFTKMMFYYNLLNEKNR